MCTAMCMHGSMPTNSIIGKRYFVTFVDDYTRFCTVYFMRSKTEGFDKFKEFELHCMCDQRLFILSTRDRKL